MDKPVVKVVGLGNGGTAAVNHMVEAGLRGVQFITVNTAAAVSEGSLAPTRLLMGGEAARGMGAEGDPARGERAATAARDEVAAALRGADMVVLVGGLGGGTATGALPVIARVAREQGALAVGVVTKPFSFEGPRRTGVARAALAALQSALDATIVLASDKLLHVEHKHVTPAGAFRLSNDLALRAVEAVCGLVTAPNGSGVPMRQLRELYTCAGVAALGTASGPATEQGVRAAAEKAIFSPLLERPVRGAERIVVTLASGPDLTPLQAGQVAAVVAETCEQNDASVVFGWVIDPSLKRCARVSVVAMDFVEAAEERPARASVAPETPLNLPLRLGDRAARSRGQVRRAKPQVVRLMTPEEEASASLEGGMDIPGFLGQLASARLRGGGLMAG